MTNNDQDPVIPTIPNWLQRAAEIADEVEGERDLRLLLAQRISGWPQNLYLGSDGQPIADCDYNTVRLEVERCATLLRHAFDPIQVRDALLLIPLPVLRGLRFCAGRGVIPANLVPPAKT